MHTNDNNIFKILTIDGGGIKGLSASILANSPKPLFINTGNLQREGDRKNETLQIIIANRQQYDDATFIDGIKSQFSL